MDDAGSGQVTEYAARLAALRAELARQGVDAFLVPRSDEHLGEYVPPSAERLAWISGFTGSAGLAVVATDRAWIWSDGRYVIQLAAETDGALWSRMHLVEKPPAAFLAREKPGLIGYDPWLVSETMLAEFRKAGLALAPLASNPIDAIWRDRPAPPASEARPHPLDFAGVASEVKREQVAGILREESQDAAVLTDPASLAWLFNIRGEDVATTPFALGFALIHADGGAELFMSPTKLPEETRRWLGNAVSTTPVEDLPQSLARLAGKRVRLDPAGSPAWFGDVLRQAGAEIVPGGDPSLVPRACKNVVEQEGARRAHRRDAVALATFLALLDDLDGATEVSLSDRLSRLRAAQEHARGDSFPAIIGVGEHGAIMHYRPRPETDRPVTRNDVLLIDSGGQYLDGTTDVTRAVWTGPDVPPAEVRLRYTLVLKGHLALSAQRFPAGIPGVRLDSIARQFLWQHGLDYDHGTGHGVGSFLSVHEGPVRISPHLIAAGLQAGMVLSNEPGFYKPGAYGIRIENLLLAREAGQGEDGKMFLDFETLTLAPYDRRLIDPALLTESERQAIDAYHARVWTEIGPLLEPRAQAWLARETAPLEAVR